MGLIEMNMTFYKAICLSLVIGLATQVTQAAAMNKVTKPVNLNLEKQLSPIEKALSQQKRDRFSKNSFDQNDQMKVITSLKYAPTQNFLAEQHQRFSRFVQFIFPQHNS